MGDVTAATSVLATSGCLWFYTIQKNIVGLKTSGLSSSRHRESQLLICYCAELVTARFVTEQTEREVSSHLSVIQLCAERLHK